jgi:hypothetical protein
MALPASYTEQQLSAFMRSELAGAAEVLGWSNIETDGDYQEAVNDTLLAYPVTDIANATDIAKLRAIAAVAVWRRAVRSIADKVDVEIGGQRVSASKLQAQFLVALANAEDQVVIYAPDVGAASMPPVGVGQLNVGNSPYRVNRKEGGGVGYLGFWEPGSQ